MADPIPFVLAGVVVSWDPVPRYPVCWLRSPGRGAGRGRRSARPVATCHGHRPSTEARRRAVGGDEDRSASARVLTSPPAPATLGWPFTHCQDLPQSSPRCRGDGTPCTRWRSAQPLHGCGEVAAMRGFSTAHSGVRAASCASRPRAIYASRDRPSGRGGHLPRRAVQGAGVAPVD